VGRGSGLCWLWTGCGWGWGVFFVGFCVLGGGAAGGAVGAGVEGACRVAGCGGCSGGVVALGRWDPRGVPRDLRGLRGVGGLRLFGGGREGGLWEEGVRMAAGGFWGGGGCFSVGARIGLGGGWATGMVGWSLVGG